MKIATTNELALEIYALGGKAGLGIHTIKAHCKKVVESNQE